MDDDDDQVEDMDEPRQGPPGRAALIRERHEAMLARKRQGHSRLPPGVVAGRLRRIPTPSTPARDSGSQTIVKHTSEAKPMPDISPTLVSMAAKQAAEGLTNAQLATLLHCSNSSVSNLKAGRTQASVALLGRIKCWVEGQPIPEPPLAPKPEKRPAALPERPADRPILPGPVLADRIAAGTEMGPEAKRQVDEELKDVPLQAANPQVDETCRKILAALPPNPQPATLGSDGVVRFGDVSISALGSSPAPYMDSEGMIHIPAGNYLIIDPDGVANQLRSLGATRAGDIVANLYTEVLRLRGSVDLVDSERAELTELRAMRDGLRKLAAG